MRPDCTKRVRVRKLGNSRVSALVLGNRLVGVVSMRLRFAGRCRGWRKIWFQFTVEVDAFEALPDGFSFCLRDRIEEVDAEIYNTTRA